MGPAELEPSMSRGIAIGLVDFAALSFDFDGARLVSIAPFLVRNWFG